MKQIAASLLLLALPGTARALEVKTLPAPKGEEIWYVSDHTLPMIALSAALPAGSAYDPADKAGLANFAAELLDEGAGAMKAGAFQTALSNRAIRLSVTTDRDYLIVSLVTLAGNAKDAFDLLGQALAHPRFDGDAIARVRSQIAANIADQDQDPDNLAEKAFFRGWFHDGPYGHAVEGDAQSLAAIGAKDLKRFAATHWVSRGLRIAVAGDVNEEQLDALIKSAFGGLSSTGPRAPVLADHPGGPRLTVVDMAMPQSNVVFGLPGILRSDPDYLPAYVANYILGGGGFASRLTTELRVKSGLTYDVSTSLESMRKAGLVLGDVATKRSSTKKTIAAMRDVLRNFAQNGPTEAELADARTYLAGSWPLAFSSNVGIADQLCTFERLGLSVDYVRNRNALINAVTLDQVKLAARQLFNPAKLSVVVAGGLGPAPANASHSADVVAP
ncbi:MAG TPA: pitrilysin family protein [Rhizomicrobium sp.]|nr:pitrilysin family protein [Rhizomicrobium sp.]